MGGPLDELLVADFSRILAGPYASMLLGDLGADVVKVEFPGGRRGGGGDIMRWAGHSPEGAPDDLGPIFMTINRNKRSILLDLRDEAAMAALRDLIRTSDVFALSASDGKQRWRSRVSSEVLAPPTLANGLVLVRSVDNRIVAFDEQDGKRRWVYQRAPASLVVRSPAGVTVVDETAYAGFSGGKLPYDAKEPMATGQPVCQH